MITECQIPAMVSAGATRAGFAEEKPKTSADGRQAPLSQVAWGPRETSLTHPPGLDGATRRGKGSQDSASSAGPWVSTWPHSSAI